MANQFQAPKGTVDILPDDLAGWRKVEELARELFPRYRYSEIRTPIFENTEVFTRGIGENTDIVGKEMFTIEREKRSLTLRPENTAGVARAYVEHKLYTRPAPQKLWYLGPMFRAERPQKGRQQQFTQLGVECLGSEAPMWDAEAIVLAADFLERLGLAGLEIQLNSVGCGVCRPVYREALQTYLRGHLEELCENCQTRTEKNPLRVLDCKVPKCAPIIANAPPIDASLCAECTSALSEVVGLLTAAGIKWQRNARLVRGLDYYTRTVFEIVAGEGQGLGSQSTVCAGGRYNGLVAELGGPETPAVGWALGVERLLLLMGAQAPRAGEVEFIVMSTPRTPVEQVFKVAQRLRDRGLTVDIAPTGKLDKQFKQAEKLGARYAFIVGEAELAEGVLKVKDLGKFEETRVGLSDAELDAWLAGRADAGTQKVEA